MIRWMRTTVLGRATALTVCALALAACGSASVTPNANQALSGNSSTSTTSGTGTATAGSGTTTTTTTTTAADPVAFSSSTYDVNQGIPTVTVTVTRSGPSTEAITVDYATADGTALAGADYTSASGTLEWAENDSTPQSITIPVSSAVAFSGTKSFSILLSNPSVGAVIGSPSSATVTITGAASLGTVGSLQLADAVYTVAQSAQSVTITVNRTGGATGATSIAYATSDGTAIAGTDYTAASGTLAWDDGDGASKSFSAAISDATAFAGSKSLTVTLSAPTGGAMLGTPASATVTIIGDASAPAGSLTLSAASYTVAQNAGTVTVTGDRVGGSNGAVSVNYGTTGGTAVAGTDYTTASGTLDWASGDATPKSFTVPISNATPFVGSVTFTVNLSNPSPGATIANPGRATVTIAGDAAPPVGTLVLSAANYSVAQNAGTVTLAVDRVGGSSGAASVDYATANGSAAAGTDFTAVTGALHWNDGDATPKSVTIPISNAAPFSGDKSFRVTISNPSAGAVVGAPQTATIVIVGDAVAPAVGSLQLSANGYSVNQRAGSITVTVNRTGGSSGAITVAYATSNGSAAAGGEYTAANGTLAWANGDAGSKTFTVTVNTSPAFSGDKTFGVALSAPSGGAGIATPGSATVTIVGDGTVSPGSTFWVYHDGFFAWGGDYSSGAVPNYHSTAGNPESGGYDIAVTLTGRWGLWAPYAGGTVPTWNFNDTGYNYIVLDLKPTVPNQVWTFYFMQVHDVQIIGENGKQIVLNIADYGPAPQVGVWATYKIPLSLVLTQWASGSPVYETSVYKFGLQDETGLAQNTWYIDNVGFTQ